MGIVYQLSVRTTWNDNKIKKVLILVILQVIKKI